MPKSKLVYVAPLVAALGCYDEPKLGDSGVVECVKVEEFGQYLSHAVLALTDPSICTDLQGSGGCESALERDRQVLEIYLDVLSEEACVPVSFTQEVGEFREVDSRIEIEGENAQFYLVAGGRSASVGWNTADREPYVLKIGDDGNESMVKVEAGGQNFGGPETSVYSHSIEAAQTAILDGYEAVYGHTASLDRDDFDVKVTW